VALCLKSGNSSILRGGSEAIRSNIAIFESLRKAADRFAIPRGAMNLVTRTGRAVVEGLLRQNSFIDLVIPRGGESLIKTVASVSRIPVIKHYKGVCHTFVDWPCDIKMAEEICLNAKVQRPGVCNAMETLLVHKDIAGAFLPRIVRRLKNAGVEIRGCPRTMRIMKDKTIKPATEADWYTEYLALILSVKVVDSVDEAIRHIAKYGSQHSDAIVTDNYSNAMKFLREVDSACVYVNASTRFTDGKQFGKGAEIGISTERLHARGPMGLEELTTYKYIIFGKGQIRK
jgi:glutamate-5-semialdehyde dehydrogenase